MHVFTTGLLNLMKIIFFFHCYVHALVPTVYLAYSTYSVKI